MTASPSSQTGTPGTAAALATRETLRQQSPGANASAASSLGDRPLALAVHTLWSVAKHRAEERWSGTICKTHACAMLLHPTHGRMCDRLLLGSRCASLVFLLMPRTDGCRCARHTEEECIRGGIFGLPESLAETERGAIEALAPGLPLFLFNFQTRVSTHLRFPHSAQLHPLMSSPAWILTACGLHIQGCSILVSSIFEVLNRRCCTACLRRQPGAPGTWSPMRFGAMAAVAAAARRPTPGRCARKSWQLRTALP
jgi:hypothetical protein